MHILNGSAVALIYFSNSSGQEVNMHRITDQHLCITHFRTSPPSDCNLLCLSKQVFRCQASTSTLRVLYLFPPAVQRQSVYSVQFLTFSLRLLSLSLFPLMLVSVCIMLNSPLNDVEIDPENRRNFWCSSSVQPVQKSFVVMFFFSSSFENNSSLASILSLTLHNFNTIFHFSVNQLIEKKRKDDCRTPRCADISSVPPRKKRRKSLMFQARIHGRSNNTASPVGHF